MSATICIIAVNIVLWIIGWIVLCAMIEEREDIIIQDIVCTVFYMASLIDMIIGVICHDFVIAACAIICLINYILVWLTNRKCQKQSQLVICILTAIIQSGLIGYLVH